MNSTDRKKLVATYKDRIVTGGIYIVRNLRNNKILIDTALDITGIRNRFDFAKKMGTSFSPKIQNDWDSDGEGCFVFEVLEELEKGKTQNSKEFSEDLKVLKEIWKEKLSKEEFY